MRKKKNYDSKSKLWPNLNIYSEVLTRGVLHWHIGGHEEDKTLALKLEGGDPVLRAKGYTTVHYAAIRCVYCALLAFHVLHPYHLPIYSLSSSSLHYLFYSPHTKIIIILLYVSIYRYSSHIILHIINTK